MRGSPSEACSASAFGAAEQADGLGGQQQVLALRDGQADHARARGRATRQAAATAPRRGQAGQRKTQEQAHQQADQEADDGGHELRGRQLLDAPDQPACRHDRQVRQDREADHDPGDDPRRRPARRRLRSPLKRPPTGRRPGRGRSSRRAAAPRTRMYRINDSLEGRPVAPEP